MSQTPPNKICWFHPNISREEGENLLLSDPRKINGLFIVRESKSSPSDYALSVLCDDQVHNYQIRRHQEDAFFSINELVKFHGLENLIDYYRNHPLIEGLYLIDFIKGIEPPHETRRSGSSTLLHRATHVGEVTIVMEIVRSGYHAYDAKNQEGKTSAHLAAINGQNEILKELISRVNVNLRDATGSTPLHYACKYNRPDTVHLLVTLGKANIQAQNTENGEVPLHVAAAEGHLDVIKVLLSLNAPLNPRTKKNLLPAQLARMNNHIECAEFLELYECPSPKIHRNQFYHGTLDRREAEDKIKQYGQNNGTFLVRYSDKNDSFILTLFYEKMCNYIIRKKDIYLFIDEGPLLNSMEHLVEYYSFLADGLPTELKFPVPPPPKPDAPPISTLKKQKHKSVKQKLSLPNLPLDEETCTQSISSDSNLLQNILFSSEIFLFNNNNNNDKQRDREDNLISPTQLKCGNLIGNGEFADVFEGVLMRFDGEEMKVAIKTLRSDQESNIENFRREADVMMKLNHHCIVKLLGVCLEPSLQMIQELVALGSILQYIEMHSDEINPNFEFKIWAAQIACGMHYLEENRFVHRDLAARNILLATKYQAKISDFGLTRALEQDNELYRAFHGGRWPIKWLAPESYTFGQFDNKSDVWSFGVTIWEMYSFGAHPYGEETKGSEAIELIDQGKRLEQPADCPDEIYDKMIQCWSYARENRPSFKELADFFQSDTEYINIQELILETDLA